ncbi:two-component system response regulator OmpR [Thioalkalivibrio denitrificans]|uniref:Two-component system response regulator OmpR n=1 Tax=Thioalkalivibrio denitrificans TaxID=108003 RepID=A0A1V3NEB9_9GAMM|nr:response regulator [Thioalkalivibrio denitrificans]OOG23410.1 two-component system response regulator OmpR [Thioalkalivibrio denitrificans]
MNAGETILIVDDDQGLRDLLQRYLQEGGYQAAAVPDGRAMDEYLAAQTPDLIILDLMLPGEDGLAIARRLRARHDWPVIMLSARGEEVDRIVGLEVGADDYLPKPFNPRELLARIRAVLRRRVRQVPGGDESRRVVAFGPFRLDLDGYVLTRDGDEVALTAGDLALLRVFAEHANSVLSRDKLLDLLKGYERSPFDRSVDVRVTRLRRKIEEDPSSPRYIRTVWGVGYVFTPSGQRG